ncbi:MAG: hypothetical protein WBD38_04745 [Candidatus Dormiibacterota bacterium]
MFRVFSIGKVLPFAFVATFIFFADPGAAGADVDSSITWLKT